MRKKIRLIIGIIILAPIAYLTFLVLKSNAIYKNMEMEEIPVNESKFIEKVKFFNNDSIILNFAYFIDGVDTTVTFDIGQNETGLLWIIPNKGNLNPSNFEFTKNETIVERKDGSYKNYTCKSKPLVNLMYKHGKKAERYENLKVETLSQYDFVFNSNKKFNYLYSEIDGVIQLKNESGNLIYRIELGAKTKVYIFKDNNSLNMLFIQ